MKYFSIILNVILAVALVVLYILFFSRSAKTESPAGNKSDSLAASVNITIAYIVEDSLLNNYDYFHELAKGLEKKRKDMENDYTLKAQGLQKEIETYQRTAGNMTLNQAKAVEEDLMKKRQNLMVLQDKMGQDLMKAEADVNSKLYDKVSSYLEDYAKENGYTLIFNVKRGNAVMYGHKGMDITKTIVNGLNEDYNAVPAKNTKPAVKADTTSSQ